MRRIDLLSPSETKRLEAAWLDPEVTLLALAGRFRVKGSDLETLREKLGPKARPSTSCRVDGGKPHRLLGNGWAR